MSQPTTVREYTSPRPKQPGITFPESHGLPVRLAASGWLGIPCLPSSEFRTRIAGGQSRQNTSFEDPCPDPDWYKFDHWNETAEATTAIAFSVNSSSPCWNPSMVTMTSINLAMIVWDFSLNLSNSATGGNK